MRLQLWTYYVNLYKLKLSHGYQTFGYGIAWQNVMETDTVCLTNMPMS